MSRKTKDPKDEAIAVSETEKHKKLPGLYKDLGELHFKRVKLEEKIDEIIDKIADIQFRGSKMNVEMLGKLGHFKGILEKNGEIKWEELKKGKTDSGLAAILENDRTKTEDRTEDEPMESKPEIKPKRFRRKK